MYNKNIHSAIILCGGMSRRMGEDKGLMKIDNKPMIVNILEIIAPQFDEIVLVFNDNDRIAKYKSSLQKFLISKHDIFKEESANYRDKKDVFSNDKNNISSKYKIDRAEYDFGGFNISLVFAEDEIKDKGPLSGIMTGLKTIATDYALVLPCDSPYITCKFTKHIFSILNKNLVMNNNIDSITPFYIEDLESYKNVVNRLSDDDELKYIISENDGFFYKSITNDILREIIINNSEPLHSIYKKDNHIVIERLLKSDEKQAKSLLKLINSYFIIIDDEKIEKINFKNINSKKDLLF